MAWHVALLGRPPVDSHNQHPRHPRLPLHRNSSINTSHYFLLCPTDSLGLSCSPELPRLCVQILREQRRLE